MMASSESQRVLNAGCTKNNSSYIIYFIYHESCSQVWTDVSAKSWVGHKKMKKTITTPCTFLLPTSETCSNVHLCYWWHQRCQPTKIGREKINVQKVA
jgi:hypothetical protein